MNEEKIKQIVEGTLVQPDIDKLSYANSSAHLWNQIKAGVNMIPVFGGAIAQEIQNIQNYRDSEFFRKYVAYIYEMKDTSAEGREKFIEEIQEKAKDYPGNVISSMVDRMDNINKEAILAKLSIARINGLISIEEFFRLSSMLERIPYVDLLELPNYQQDYYDESGDTELLFTSGALIQSVLDAQEGDKYVLSKLGMKLLRFGLGIQIDTDQPVVRKEINATNGLSWEEVGEVDDSKLEDAISRKLAKKEYEESDQAMFDYDATRGK